MLAVESSERWIGRAIAWRLGGHDLNSPRYAMRLGEQRAYPIDQPSVAPYRPHL
jgi:hypothetical protein